jgi:polar amino acid transport system substrate-binding protein
MRKLLMSLLVLFVSLSLFISCGNGDKTEKVLKVGTNAEYPPFEYKENNEFKGIDMDLIRLLGKKLGYEIKIVDMDFDSLIPSVTLGKVDMAIAAMTITEDRKKQVDFSIPYYTANQAIVVKKDSNISIGSEADLSKYTIGSQNGTTGQIYIDDNFIKAGKMDKKQLKKYPTNIEALTDLLNGNVDCVIIDDSAGDGYSKIKPIKTVFKIETGENYGIALPKNSPISKKINSALKSLLDSKDWVELIEKYM